MNRKTASMLAIWLPFAAAAAAEVPLLDEAVLRQRLLATLADEISREDLRAAAVVVSGDLAAVCLPPGDPGPEPGGVYLLERDPGDADRWHPVTRITVSGEEHFGDAVILGGDTVLVAAPDIAGAGLGPGMAYVFQRHVGGSNRWGLVARLAPAAYPPAGAVEVRQLAPPAAAAATSPPPEPPATAAGASAEQAEELDREATVVAPAEAAGDRRFIVVANMSEKPRAFKLASGLRAAGYPSEIHRNQRGFYVVTLAHLPADEARKMRAAAVQTGDIPADSYLVVGTSFRERISP